MLQSRINSTYGPFGRPLANGRMGRAETCRLIMARVTIVKEWLFGEGGVSHCALEGEAGEDLQFCSFLYLGAKGGGSLDLQ